MAFESPFALSLCPRITSDEQTLTACTSWSGHLLTLGASSKRAVVDLPTRSITITRRLGWFYVRTQLIEFRQIAAVTYGYDDLNPASFFGGAYDSIDRFVVGLKLIGADELRLFSFIGDGVFTNQTVLPDWWYWDDIIFDMAGPQERESRFFAVLLSKLIGVSIAPSMLTKE